MKDKYFDLFAGGERKIILANENEQKHLKINTIKSDKDNLPFFKKCKLKDTKNMDGVSGEGVFMNNLRPKVVQHGFFKEIKKMTIAAFLICAFFVFSNGVSSGIQKKIQISDFGKNAVNKGYTSLETALSGDISTAIKILDEADFYLSEMQTNIDFLLHQTENLFNYTSDIESLDCVIKLAEEVNNTTKVLLQSFEKIKNISLQLSLETNYINLIDDIFADLQKAVSHLQKAQIHIEKLKKTQIAKKYSKQISLTEEYLSKIVNTLNDFSKHQDAIQKLLGKNYPHDIMFLFQNSSEIRANGGFIGSLLFVTFNKGKIVDYKFKDVFDYDSQLHDGIIPPEPFIHISENWGLRDANYYPNFPDSAKKIRWFLERSKGDSVDTIIAVNEQVIRKFLEKTGDLQLFENGEYVNSDNFSMILSFFVEAKIFGENTPKKVLEEFIPIFFDSIKKIKIDELLYLSSQSVLENHILAFSFDNSIEDFFIDLGVSGKMNSIENQNFLSVVHSSISANKSDGFIKESINHKAYINLAGEVFNKVNISRNHNWGIDEEEKFNKLFEQYGQNSLRDKEALRFILGGGKNQVWTRVYAPLNAKIISVKGINKSDVKVNQENGFTIFSFYYPPIFSGEKKDVEIYYSLHEKTIFDNGFAPYYFCFKKAAGIDENYFLKDLELENGLQIITSDEVLPYQKNQKTDKCFSILLGRESLAKN